MGFWRSLTKHPPAVLYWNNFDQPGDTAEVTEMRGRVAEHLDVAQRHADRSMSALGVAAMANMLGMPLLIKGPFFVGSCIQAGKVAVHLALASDVVSRLIDTGYGQDFDTIMANQQLDAMGPIPPGAE